MQERPAAGELLRGCRAPAQESRVKPGFFIGQKGYLAPDAPSGRFCISLQNQLLTTMRALSPQDLDGVADPQPKQGHIAQE